MCDFKHAKLKKILNHNHLQQHALIQLTCASCIATLPSNCVCTAYFGANDRFNAVAFLDLSRIRVVGVTLSLLQLQQTTPNDSQWLCQQTTALSIPLAAFLALPALTVFKSAAEKLDQHLAIYVVHDLKCSKLTCHTHPCCCGTRQSPCKWQHEPRRDSNEVHGGSH